MTTIVTRAGKGSPLTNTEVDTNFTNLNSDKLETSGGTLSGPTVVSVNSASDALRITQTGAGNALVVEDSANPDATPFVVDASGKVINGYTATFAGLPATSAEYTQLGSIGFMQNGRYNAASSGPAYNTMKSRSTTIGSWSIVSSGDEVGAYRFWGDGGSAFIEAARITAAVDGTPGTNDMPGRLIFSTTADGASSPTERMRISNEGSVGVGAVSQAQNTLRVTRNITGSTFSAGIVSDGQVQSGVTSRADYFLSAAACAAGTYGAINGFQAQQSTFTGTVAIQNGYRADASLIGATTNTGFIAENTAAITAGKTAYGFYSAVNTATGGGTTWGFYAGGTAANYFAGQVQLGAGTAAAPALSTTGDTNTGIFFPAADTIAFTEGGVESMRIDSSGNVGIGTSSPGSTLDVNGAITGRAVGGEGGELRLNNPTNASVGMYVDVSSADSGRVFSVSNNFVLSLGQLGGTGGAVLLYTAATERFRVGPLGQLGINGANYGTSGQVLTSNGSAAAPSWQTASSTGALKNVQVFTSSGTYTRTAGVTTAVVVARGGGGGSSGKINNGSTGGTTSFGSHVSAVGGSGGSSNSANPSNAANGGAGGTGGTGATIAIKGAPGTGGYSKDPASVNEVLRGAGGGEGGGPGGTGATAVAGVRGGGASGGSASDGPFQYVGGGGGQGELCIKYTTTVGATETVTIGAGGAAGNSGAAGGAGYIIVYEYS